MEWLRLWPKAGPRPQLWQTFDIRPRSVAEGGPSRPPGHPAGRSLHLCWQFVTIAAAGVTLRWLG
jgi:hypothetical protein